MAEKSRAVVGMLLGVAFAVGMTIVGLTQARQPRPVVIPPDGGDTGTGPNGVVAKFKVGSISTGSSQLQLGTGIVPPGASVPVHLHEIDEEILYVLEGTLIVTLDDKEYVADAGTTVFIPPKTWMAYANRSNAPAKLLGVLPRGELEECFRGLYPTGPSAGTVQHDAAAAHPVSLEKLCRTQLRNPAR